MAGKNTNSKFQRGYLVITGIFIVVMTYITMSHYKCLSFMYDELYTIGFISEKNTVTDLFRVFFTDEVTNPPLYDLFMYFWYRIVPWGEGWMLFPNLVFFIIGLLSISILLLKYTKNVRNTLFIFVVSWLNPGTFEYMLYYLRSYSMVFMLSGVALLWHDKCEDDSTSKNVVLYGLILTCLSLTHYFGAIVTLAFGIFDLVNIVIKKKEWKHFLAYVFAGMATGSYLFIALMHRTKNIASFWPPAPGIKDIWNLFCAFLMNRYGVLAFAAVIVVFIVSYFAVPESKTQRCVPSALLISFFAIVFTVILTFTYSAFINPNGSIIVQKYFWVLVPEILFVFAFCLDHACTILRDKLVRITDKEKEIDKIFVVGFLLCLVCFSVLLMGRKVFKRLRVQIVTEPVNKNMAEYLQNEVDPKSGCVLAYKRSDSQWDGSDYPLDGFKEYYLSGKAADIEFTCDTEEAKKYNKVCLWYTMYGFGMFDEETNEVDEKVIRDMSGYDLKEIRKDRGLLIFEKLGERAKK